MMREYLAKRTIWRYWNRRMAAVGRKLREQASTDEGLVG